MRCCSARTNWSPTQSGACFWPWRPVWRTVMKAAGPSAAQHLLTMDTPAGDFRVHVQKQDDLPDM